MPRVDHWPRQKSQLHPFPYTVYSMHWKNIPNIRIKCWTVGYIFGILSIWLYVKSKEERDGKGQLQYKQLIPAPVDQASGSVCL